MWVAALVVSFGRTVFDHDVDWRLFGVDVGACVMGLLHLALALTALVVPGRLRVAYLRGLAAAVIVAFLVFSALVVLLLGKAAAVVPVFAVFYLPLPAVILVLLRRLSVTQVD